MTEQDWISIHQAAREEAQKIVSDHLGWCPFAKLQIEERVRGIENRFTLLVGFMVGSGLLGGTAGALITKLIGH
jgi:hypothetical protein